MADHMGSASCNDSILKGQQSSVGPIQATAIPHNSRLGAQLPVIPTLRCGGEFCATSDTTPNSCTRTIHTYGEAEASAACLVDPAWGTALRRDISAHTRCRPVRNGQPEQDFRVFADEDVPQQWNDSVSRDQHAGEEEEEFIDETEIDWQDQLVVGCRAHCGQHHVLLTPPTPPPPSATPTPLP